MLAGGLELDWIRLGERVAVLVLNGEIDITNCPEFETALDKVMESPRLSDVVVDVSDVGFLAGVRCLETLQACLEDRGLRLLLVVEPGAVTATRSRPERELPGRRVAGAGPRLAFQRSCGVSAA